MSSDSRSPCLNQVVDTSVVWLVSFGDLLTLLFCLFLVLTPRLGGTVANQSAKEGVSSDTGLGVTSGTQLATPHQEAPGVSIASIPVTVAKEHSQSSQERRKRAQSAFALLRARAASATISARVRVCEGSLSAEYLQDLFAEARVAYGNLRAPEFEYAVSCDRIVYDVSADEDLIAVIEFSRL